MKISEQWLRELINPAISTDKLVYQLTMAGLEVDDVVAAAGRFSSVIIGKIIAKKDHPTLSKYSIYTVEIEQNKSIQIVSICRDINLGTKLACAVEGALLPQGIKVIERDFKHEISQGLFCGFDTLGIVGEKRSGIVTFNFDAPLGAAVDDYLALQDKIISIDLTPNRGDCLSMLGIAREVAAANEQTYIPAAIVVNSIDNDFSFPVKISVPDLCPHYTCRVITDLDIKRPSPVWMQERLYRAGMGCNNIVVDVTNYVMLEMGQPLHAFDLDKLQQEIVVRSSVEGEKITLLNGIEYDLKETTLVVADNKKPIAIAGVMGSLPSATSLDTTNIVLESAYFTPLAVAGCARSYGLNTQAAYRYERGVDSNLQRRALECATALIQQYAGGKIGKINEYGKGSEEIKIALDYTKIVSVLGIDIGIAQVVAILARLSFIVKQSNQVLSVTVPSYRFDIKIGADLIEEIARCYGYDNLPTSVISPDIKMHSSGVNSAIPGDSLSSHLCHLGYFEAMTYSFIDASSDNIFDCCNAGIELANPISANMSVMRSSLLPSLIKALDYNYKQSNTKLRLFERGHKFVQNKDKQEVAEIDVIAGILAAENSLLDKWMHKDITKVDFFSLKGEIDSWFSSHYEIRVEYKKSKLSFLHPGQAADLYYANQIIGYIGRLHPQVSEYFDLPSPPFVFEIDITKLPAFKIQKVKQISAMPTVKRDLALVVADDISYLEVESAIVAAAGEYLIGVKLFDYYTGDKIALGTKSFALSLVWQHNSKTLSDVQINNDVEIILAALKSSFGICLRS